MDAETKERERENRERKGDLSVGKLMTEMVRVREAQSPSPPTLELGVVLNSI